MPKKFRPAGDDWLLKVCTLKVNPSDKTSTKDDLLCNERRFQYTIWMSMQYMKHTIDIASATAVSTSGRSEWTSNFCSVRASSRIIRQLSGPRFMSNSRKPAPLKRKSKQPIKTSTYDTISNNFHVTVKPPPVMATQIWKAIAVYSCSGSRGRYPTNATSKTSAWENTPACFMEERLNEIWYCEFTTHSLSKFSFKS